MRIGVLAVQGAFIEHRHMVEQLGAESLELRKACDLEKEMDGLILPGGESTVMGKLLTELQMMEPLRQSIRQGLPTFGTCAGMILMAKDIVNPTPNQVNLGTMNITVQRNAYGRQLGSFHTEASFGNMPSVPMTFIRAPYIKSAGKGVSILSEVKGNITAARQGNQLATAFHPELTGDTSIHQYFLDMVQDV